MSPHSLASTNLRIDRSLDLGRRILEALGPLESWFERRGQHRQLSAFDDRALADLGLSRVDVARETGTAFWRT